MASASEKSKLKKLIKKITLTMLRAMWVPLLWVLIVVATIGVFPEGRAGSFWGRLFEDLAFLTSFLFYRHDWLSNPQSQTPSAILIRAFMQFAFWWAFGISMYWAYSLRHKFRK